MSISPMPIQEQMVTNGFCAYRWVRWFDELVNGHVGDAATLDGQLPAYYATAAHLHTGVYAPAAAFTSVTFSALDYYAATGSWVVALGEQIVYQWTLNGTKLAVNWQIDSSSTTDPTATISLALPGGHLPARNASATHTYGTFTTGWDIGSAQVTAGVARIVLYTRDQTNWPVSGATLYTRGQITVEVV